MKLRTILLGLTEVAAFVTTGACGDDKESPARDEAQGVACEGDTCIISGTIVNDLTLTSDKEWLLRGGVFVGDDTERTVLTIEPGTQIFGETSTGGMLVIRRGSQIMAEGTAAAPIVFTSSKDPGTRARGDWGGLIINGRAPVNGCTEGVCESYGEGGTGWYGGSDPDDDSGVLRYVRVEFAGRLISPTNELNGIAFQGVGAGTTVEYVQAHMVADDGVEFFGGTVNAKHLVVTGVDDDMLDWTDGWVGKVQFAVLKQHADASDNGIEADNNEEAMESLPRSSPTLSNITLIGSPDSSKSDVGILLRHGTAAAIHNSIVLGFNEACLDIDSASTFAEAQADSLSIKNSIVSCVVNFKEDDEDEVTQPFTVESWFMTAGWGNLAQDPELIDPHSESAPDYRPASTSPAASGAVVPTDSFFEQVSFKGGVDPANDWTAGWTNYAQN